MDFVARIFGILLVLLGVAFPLWRHLRKDAKASPHKGDIPIGFLIGILGIGLLIEGRITELPTPFGKIQAATEQALADAGDISRLKAQAQDQTATINLVASEATKAKGLSETLSGQVTEAQRQLAFLKDASTAAQATLATLKQDEDFIMMVLAAQNDNRVSYDKLRELALDKSNRFAETAAAAWHQIQVGHGNPIYLNFSSPWPQDVDPSKMSLGDLSQRYETSPANLKPAILEYISNRNDIPKRNRLEFFVGIMAKDQSLTAVEYAARNFIRVSGLPSNTYPMALDNLTSWWVEHRHEFDGK